MLPFGNRFIRSPHGDQIVSVIRSSIKGARVKLKSAAKLYVAASTTQRVLRIIQRKVGRVPARVGKRVVQGACSSD